ncbi:MAG: alpha/beta hydrolase [Burkholderiales bacterium]|nr:alpha/beta hydrolase [Burkholderiales bacterium]
MIARLVRFAGVLLMLTALALTLAQEPERPVQTLVARWAPPPSDFIDLGGQLVHLRDEGPRNDPQPIVLLHAFGGSLHTWEGWARVLRQQRRVIRLDLPGNGLTGPWSGRYAGNDYAAATEARFVLDLLDRLQVPRAVLGGNGLGGEVAARLALLAPSRVAALVLVDASGITEPPATPPPLLRVARLPLWGWLGPWVLPHPFVTQALAAAYGHRERLAGEVVDRYFELALREGNRTAYAQALRDDQPGAAPYAALKLPTLIVWGGRDRLLPPAQAQRLQQAVAGSERVVIDDLGHLPQEEDAARSLVPVRAFLGLH